MALFSTVINQPQVGQPVLIFQSAASQSSLPLLRRLLIQSLGLIGDGPASNTYTLLFCLFYHPSTLLGKNVISSSNSKIYDWVSFVSGYEDGLLDLRADIFSAVKNAPSGSINVIIDSVDTLSSEVGSLPETYQFLRDLQSVIRARQDCSRLILHILQWSPLRPLLLQTAFSPSLMHISVHHPNLLVHLAKDYLTPPPPLSHDTKFWGIFIPISERGHDSDSLVFGAEGEGSGNSAELVLETLIRGLDNFNRKRGVERSLEGWSSLRNDACDLMDLEDLNFVGSKRIMEEKSPDPTQNVSFNLTLTPLQQQSRAQIPLPYAHEGKPMGRQNAQAAIFYDPDSADDIDDDDPDEDLDI